MTVAHTALPLSLWVGLTVTSWSVVIMDGRMIVLENVSVFLAWKRLKR